MRELLYQAHYRRGGAARAAGCVFGLALAVAALLPPSYRATATLAVLPATEFTVRAAAGSHDLNASALAMDQIMKAETEILGSNSLHAATLHRVGPALLYPDIFDPPERGLVRRVLHWVSGVAFSPWRVTPRDAAAAREERGVRRFAADLTVLPGKDSNVISVALQNRSGAAASGALNTMLELYALERSRLYDDPQQEIVWREAAVAAAAVKAADGRLAAFKQGHGIADYVTQRDTLLRRRSEAEQGAQDSAVAAQEHSARLAALGAQLQAEPQTVGLYTEQDADTRLQSANADMEAVRAKLAVARATYREGSRMVTTLRAELAAHEAEQSRLLRDQTLSVVRQGRNPTVDPLRLDRSREVAEVSAMRARLAGQLQDVVELDNALVGLEASEAALGALERERASAEEAARTANRIVAERRLSEAEDARRLANVRVIQPAEEPQVPRSTPLLVIAAGFVMSLLAALGWLLAGFIFDPVFLTEEGLASLIDLPVLGVFERDAAAVGVLT